MLPRIAVGTERVMPGVTEDCSGQGISHALCYQGLQWVLNVSYLVLLRIAVGMKWVRPCVTEDCSGYTMCHALCYGGLQCVRNRSCLMLLRMYSVLYCLFGSTVKYSKNFIFLTVYVLTTHLTFIIIFYTLD